MVTVSIDGRRADYLRTLRATPKVPYHILSSVLHNETFNELRFRSDGNRAVEMGCPFCHTGRVA